MQFHATNARTRLPRHVLIGIVSLVVALLLAAAFAFVVLPHPQALARVLDGTCAQSPSVDNCHHRDPELQGCVADAQTQAQVEIDDASGKQIGFLQLRFSRACDSWWGRIFDERHLPGKPLALFIQIAGDPLIAPPTYVDADQHILYSFMIYDPVLQHFSSSPPEVDGSLQQNGVETSSATIPGFAPAGSE